MVGWNFTGTSRTERSTRGDRFDMQMENTNVAMDTGDDDQPAGYAHSGYPVPTLGVNVSRFRTTGHIPEHQDPHSAHRQ